MVHKYPKHIYDPLRMEVATSIISHELKKIFPAFTVEEYAKLSSQIHNWGIDPKKYSLTKEPRDFWNGVEGIMTGFRLKGVVRFITGENVTWSKEEVAVTNFTFSTDHFHVNGVKIPTLNNTGETVLKWLTENQHLEQALAIVNESYAVGIPRVTDPLYCKKDIDNNYFVYDGNGRVLHALLHGIPTLTAYVGTHLEDTITNHWIYTMFLLNLSSLYREGVLSIEEYTRLLTNLFRKSKSAIIEYQERVPDDARTKEIILGALNE